MPDQADALENFAAKQNIAGKGPLSVAIQLTRIAKGMDFPLNPEQFKTEKEGQVRGLGGPFLKKILRDHGISRTLASEAGRTSRGSMSLMSAYVSLLNTLHASGALDLEAAEQFWACKVRDFFNSQPFELDSDHGVTVTSAVQKLFQQARKREKENPGTNYAGAVLQHLVAAKLSSVLGQRSFDIHGASVADSPTGRSGDFVIGKTVIHCTTVTQPELMEKVRKNVQAGMQPVIITIPNRVGAARSLAEDADLKEKVEIWDVEQFLSSNVHEHCGFDDAKRDACIGEIIRKYNDIVLKVETDPSLRIEFAE